jgi:aminoglycoside phosphotransferase (APT) family kinase protein
VRVVEPVLLADLLAVLREVTGEPELEFDGEPTALTGGFWAQLVAFRLAGAPVGWDGALVARVMPDAATAAKEAAFQSVISDAGYPTPTIHVARGPDDGVGGRAVTVMDLARGRPMLAGLDGVRAFGKLPSLARRLPDVLARAMADLHRIDPAPVVARLDRDGTPRPTVASMLSRLHELATALGRGDLAAAAEWLEANPTGDGHVVLCHGDLHPFNVLVDGSGVVTVLDWSVAALAPPTYDVGFTSLLLAEPPLLVPGPVRPAVRGAGRALSQRFVRAYERYAAVSVDPGALAWHQALGCLRALVEVAGWVADGSVAERGGHPWLLVGDAFAARVHALTGAPVRPR